MTGPEEAGQPNETSPGRIERAKARADALKKAGAEILAREQERRESVRVVVEAFNRDRRFLGGLLSGGLAFRVFLWLLPLALVVVALFGGLIDLFDDPPEEVALEAGLSSAMAATVAQAVEGSERSRWYLLVIGLILLLWGGMGVVKAARLISGLAWSVPPQMNHNPLAASGVLSLAVLIVMAGHQLVIALLSGPFASDFLILTVETGLLVAVGVWTFNYLPHPVGVGWKRMLPGAVLFAVGLLVTRAVGIYFTNRLNRVDDLYGALGAASVFLAWLFIICRVWVAAVGLNASADEAIRSTPNHGDPA